jgi:hypothetical protein
MPTPLARHDSTMRKRVRKMNKHKYRKLRKKLRFVTKGMFVLCRRVVGGARAGGGTTRAAQGVGCACAPPLLPCAFDVYRCIGVMLVLVCPFSLGAANVKKQD